MFTAAGCCCKSAPHLSQLAWSHLGYYYLHGTRQSSSPVLFIENACLWKKRRGRGGGNAREYGGERHCRKTVVLMYSFGPASVIKQYFSAFSNMFPATVFHQWQTWLGNTYKWVVSANQDLLDAFLLLLVCIRLQLYLEEGRQRRKMWIFFALVTSNRSVVLQGLSNVCALSCVFEVNSSSR